MKLLKVAPLALAVLMWSTLAMAGRFVVNDESRLLSASDVNGLQDTAARWPFDTHLLVTSSPKSALESRAKAWVDGPNVIVIALDPDHHTTVVRFGVGVPVKTLDFDGIFSAGNPAFREKNWRAGIEAIGSRAEMSTRTTSGTMATQPPIVIHEGLSFWGGA